MRFLLLLFIVIPIVEMFVLIKVGGVIGALPTVLLVCVTAIIGVGMIRAQGFNALQRAQQRMAAGQLPAQEIVDGLCLAIGGAMLLTPGFVTDSFGFLLLVPALRRIMLAAFVHKIITSGRFSQQQGFSSRADGSSLHETLEGEYRRDD